MPAHGIGAGANGPCEMESMAGRAAAVPTVDVAIDIDAAPRMILSAFFDGQTLTAWTGTVRSVTTPRTLGAFALEWATVDERDEVLGRLGGVLRGTVMQYERGRGFFVADMYYLPPDSGPIGPMALEVTCTPLATGDKVSTRLRMFQTGFEESARWRRYYQFAAGGWTRSFEALKALLEGTR